MKRLTLIALLAALLASCATNPPPSHNALGGYIDACGELPPLQGDDC